MFSRTMSISGDHEVLYAAVADASAGDEGEAKAAGYLCTDRSSPANWRRFTCLGVPLVTMVFLAVVVLVSTRASVDPLPFLPSFTVVSFTVRSLSLGAAASSGVRSGEFILTLAVRNPNTKADVRFRTLVAGVYYGGTVVAEARLPPMYQAALAERTVTSRLVVVASAMPRLGSGIARGGVWPDMARGGGVIRFRLEATCRLAFRVDGVETARWRKFVVRCGDVPVQLDNTTAPSMAEKLVGPRRPCSVE